MRLTHLFTKDEPIAGLEVSETHLRLALFELTEEKQPHAVLKLALEEALPQGAVRDGTLANPAAFSATLRTLLTRAGGDVRYVILSLPSDRVYAKVFSFPKAVQGQKLEETMKLNVGFLLPVNVNDVYLDWERIESSRENELFLATLKKSVVDAFVRAAATVGLNVTAVEFHPLSMARAIDVQRNVPSLIVAPGPSSTTLFIVHERTVRFTRVLPHAAVSDTHLDDEIRKLKDFYESRGGRVDRTLSLHDAKIVGPTSNHPLLRDDNGKWLVSIGAALRGLIPRSMDTLISFMPIGTEQAYEYQRAAAFTEFLSSLTVGVSAFFALIFIGAWIFMGTLQQNFRRQSEALSSVPAPTDLPALEDRAQQLNGLVQAASSIAETAPRWEDVIGELRARSVEGITISSLTVPSIRDTFGINGVAFNRTQLNAFRKSMQESELFSEASIPPTNLEQKENISFTMSLRLKDASTILGKKE